jgi:hypothetical protein
MNWISNQILNSNKKKSTNETNDELDLIYHEKQVKELCALHALNKFDLTYLY